MDTTNCPTLTLYTTRSLVFTMHKLLQSNIYHAAMVLLSKKCFLSQISEILMSISRIIEQIPGMFVLCWMHFSWWFQIWPWSSTMLTFFTKCVKFMTCRLHSLAAWKALKPNPYIRKLLNHFTSQVISFRKFCDDFRFAKITCPAKIGMCTWWALENCRTTLLCKAFNFANFMTTLNSQN